jgi:Recombination endonuclease VII
MKKQLSIEQKRNRAEYARKWRKNNPERTAEHSKRSRLKNRDKILKRQRKWSKKNKEHCIEKSKEWYRANKDRVRDLQLQKEFGITLRQYTEMLLAQNGVCAICQGGPDAKSKKLAVDHDHRTGKIRSLLCRGCNVGIGNLKDSPELLIKAAQYIKDHS